MFPMRRANSNSPDPRMALVKRISGTK